MKTRNGTSHFRVISNCYCAFFCICWWYLGIVINFRHSLHKVWVTRCHEYFILDIDIGVKNHLTKIETKTKGVP